MRKQFQRELRVIVENDEEMANCVATEPKDKQQSEQSQSKKLKNIKKQKTLRKQYENCLKADKIGNNEEKNKWQMASKRLDDTIENLYKKEHDTFWSSYVEDIKEACKKSQKKSSELNGEVKDQKDSEVKQDDYLVYKIKEMMK